VNNCLGNPAACLHSYQRNTKGLDKKVYEKRFKTGMRSLILMQSYLTAYITSFTNFTVRVTSGKANATKLGA
jgi:hypothetical protein